MLKRNEIAGAHHSDVCDEDDGSPLAGSAEQVETWNLESTWKGLFSRSPDPRAAPPGGLLPPDAGRALLLLSDDYQ